MQNHDLSIVVPVLPNFTTAWLLHEIGKYPHASSFSSEVFQNLASYSYLVI